ncbi:MAG TPA: type II toxin-antitoxin system Phd/YefM family antitoxin [Phycisphaerales bacterium]|jgi:prevent-host-death family protein|nr:type II toxin-antitoxin system Phd/YefM family antitoxin [Phycisphaerales bacterium]
MTWNVANAKNRLSEVLDRAEREGPQTIRRRGHAFVLLPADQYEELTGQRRSFKDWILKAPRLDDLELPDRSRSAMRETSL